MNIFCIRSNPQIIYRVIQKIVLQAVSFQLFDFKIYIILEILPLEESKKEKIDINRIWYMHFLQFSLQSFLRVKGIEILNFDFLFSQKYLSTY